MIIGVDIDNTITNTLPILKRYCQRYHNEVLKRNTPMNPKGFATYNLFDWTQEESQEFCNKYLEEVVLQAPVKPRAKENIIKLRDEGHKIHIISGRIKPMFKTPYETTERFLQEKGIPYDNLIVGNLDKKTSALKNHFDFMVEDEPWYINDISQVIPVMVFQYPFNEECSGYNIFKVNTWDEVYEQIHILMK